MTQYLILTLVSLALIIVVIGIFSLGRYYGHKEGYVQGRIAGREDAFTQIKTVL